MAEETLDFLKEIVASAPDLAPEEAKAPSKRRRNDDSTADENPGSPREKPKRTRKPKKEPDADAQQDGDYAPAPTPKRGRKKKADVAVAESVPTEPDTVENLEHAAPAQVPEGMDQGTGAADAGPGDWDVKQEPAVKSETAAEETCADQFAPAESAALPPLPQEAAPVVKAASKISALRPKHPLALRSSHPLALRKASTPAADEASAAHHAGSAPSSNFCADDSSCEGLPPAEAPTAPGTLHSGDLDQAGAADHQPELQAGAASGQLPTMPPMPLFASTNSADLGEEYDDDYDA